MAAGTSRKISAASARSHTRKSKQESFAFLSSGVFKKFLLVLFVALFAWAYQAARPPPPKPCGSPNGPSVTAPRIRLSDGRHLAYKELGVSKHEATYKITTVHGFDSCRHQAQVRQQGDFESIHRDLNIGFGKWEFDPVELENPFPNDDVSVHIWQGDDDRLVHVSLQRFIAEKLPWIQYHELAGAGHYFPYAEGMGDKIVSTLVK